MKYSIALRICAVAALSLPALPSAFSQEEDFFVRNRYTSVTERPQPQFDPLPIRLGVFEVEPELNTGLGYRSNLFFSGFDEQSDGFALIRPGVRGQTTWSRNQIGFEAQGEYVDYFENSSESTVTGSGRVFGRYDIGSNTSVTFAVFGESLNQPRSAAGAVVDAVEPTEYDRFGADLLGDYQSGRLRLDGRITFARINFDDIDLRSGGVLDQDFRDSEEIEVDGRAQWAVDRDWSVFARLAHVQRDSPAQSLANPFDRDSRGTNIQIGTSFELPVLIRGELAIGYQAYDFDEQVFGSPDGVSVDARLQWFVTELTTLTATAGRDVVDPGLDIAAGAFRTGVGFRADHELRRNILLRAQFDYSQFDFESIPRDDDRFDVGVGGVWKLNRKVYLDLDYQYTRQNSDFQPFTDNQISLSLRLFL